MRHIENCLLTVAFLTLLGATETYGDTNRLCGLCKVCTEIARFALSHNIINNFLLLHCSSIVSSSVCLVGADLLQNILHSLTLTEICQLEHMCSASTSGFDEKRLNLSKLESHDIDTMNIMLSRVDSVGNFTDFTVGVQPTIERVVTFLADSFPLLKDLSMRDEQRDTIVTLTNRFLMALDYKLRIRTGQGLREHLRPCNGGDKLN
ncbi:hypothetical protein GCK32_001297 [Trichostrongylus colubriformis]|uniref:Saposin B-type domain-containing protein n=1 Tax=Trichostrongylus colubriformis TaxID=6319 RepID=A0AAN8IN96_TRICO